MELIDWFRILNATLAIIAIVMLIYDTHKRWKLMSRGEVYMALAIGGLLFAVLEFSVEMIILRIHTWGPRIMFTMAATIWTIIGLWLIRKDFRE